MVGSRISLVMFLGSGTGTKMPKTPMQGHTGGSESPQGDLCLQSGEGGLAERLHLCFIRLPDQDHGPRFDTLVSRLYTGLLRGLSSPGSPTASGQPSRMSALQEWRRRRLARLACCPARLLLARLPLPRIFSGSLGSACPAVEAHASPTGHRHWEHKPRPPGEEGTEASSQGTGSREPGFPAAFHGGWDPSAESFACHRQCGCAGS